MNAQLFSNDSAKNGLNSKRPGENMEKLTVVNRTLARLEDVGRSPGRKFVASADRS